jgi:hypothetical protein
LKVYILVSYDDGVIGAFRSKTSAERDRFDASERNDDENFSYRYDEMYIEEMELED